jgi:predicted ABC-type ATPase
MKEIIMVAGPNGAGKTSFANEYLPAEQERLIYLNADEIARELTASGSPSSGLDVAAGRVMLKRIGDAVASGRDLMFETTLASLAYARKIPIWQANGYAVSIIYLRLPNAEASLARVARRVAAGGHGIPDRVVRQRFARSLDYFDRIYKPLVNEWYVWESLEGNFELAEAWDD